MLRLVCWNVRSLRDGSGAVAALLRRLAPDLVVLQEAPRLLGWRTSRSLLAHRAGLRVLTRQRAAGNLLLAAPRVQRVAAGAVLLPRTPGLHRRAVAFARVAVDGRELVLAGTHLDLREPPRSDNAARVRAALPPGPLVLGADVNEEPGGPAWRVLGEALTAVDGPPTFPARRPRRRLDGVFTDLPVRSARVLDVDSASDHRALLLELGQVDR